MNNERISNIGKKPWSYRVGTIITGAIILLGFVFQAASGGMELQMVGFPWNLISGIVFLALLILIYLLWQKHPVIKELGSIKAALPAIIGFTFLVLLMAVSYTHLTLPTKRI